MTIPVVDTSGWQNPSVKVVIGMAAVGRYTIGVVPPDFDPMKIVVLHTMDAPIPPGGVHSLSPGWTSAASGSILQVFGFATLPGGGQNIAVAVEMFDNIAGGPVVPLPVTIQQNASGAVFSSNAQKA